MSRLVFFVLLFLLMISRMWAGPGDSLHSVQTTSLYSEENILRFADFLNRRGDYPRAAAEYERFLFTATGSVPDGIYLKVGLCYNRMKKFEKAEALLLPLLSKEADTQVKDSAVVYLASVYLLSGRYHRLAEIDDFSGDETVIHQVRRLKVLGRLQQHLWEDAQALARDQFAGLSRLARKGEHLPAKSPVVAGFLSAVLPGAGKLYAGRTTDGLYSLLLIAGSGWLAWEGFRDQGIESGKGWIFGSAAAFFHLGNIYGSVMAARVYNQSVRDQLDAEIQTQIRLWTTF